VRMVVVGEGPVGVVLVVRVLVMIVVVVVVVLVVLVVAVVVLLLLLLLLLVVVMDSRGGQMVAGIGGHVLLNTVIWIVHGERQEMVLSERPAASAASSDQQTGGIRVAFDGASAAALYAMFELRAGRRMFVCARAARFRQTLAGGGATTTFMLLRAARQAGALG
jgi:hypothetical protein